LGGLGKAYEWLSLLEFAAASLPRHMAA